MGVSENIEFIALEGELFAAAAERGDLTVAIAPCPGWDMRELVRHLGLIHLWAAAHVASPHEEMNNVELEDLAPYWPALAAWPADAGLIDWYRETHANLIRVLSSAPADVDAFTFLPAVSPLAMWARRQASELAIHRFDAEMARGITSQFDPQFATDMLDELICGFAPRPRRRSLGIDGPVVILVHAEDTDDHWYLTIGDERTDATREGRAADADLTLTGSAESLYILLWNRAPDSSVAMAGNTELMDLWRKNFRVRWS